MDVSTFFDLQVKPIMQVACGLEQADYLQSFSSKFGWKTVETDWKKVIASSAIDLIDICTSNGTHEEIAVAAAEAGKHILCEKPIARNAQEAKRMMEAVRDAAVVNIVAFNYRRVPALALAKMMIEEGKIGRVFYFNAVYYQDWLVDPEFPYVWRNDIKESGSSAHGDMNAHIVDMARYLVGEIAEVNGAKEVFVKQRKAEDGTLHEVTADDSMYFLARFECGALCAFLCSRFATGGKNYLRLEIFGSEGSLVFNLKRLNELEVFSRSEPALQQGFRSILVTENQHPYVHAWWRLDTSLGGNTPLSMKLGIF
jgi:predicted dehydrogenase